MLLEGALRTETIKLFPGGGVGMLEVLSFGALTVVHHSDLRTACLT